MMSMILLIVIIVFLVVASVIADCLRRTREIKERDERIYEHKRWHWLATMGLYETIKFSVELSSMDWDM